MSKSVKVVFIKQSKKATEGTLFIRTIENRKSRKKSLGIKLDEKSYQRYFLEDKQRFRNDARFKSAEAYNEIIAERLQEASIYEDNLDLIPSKKKSFIDYWKRKIKNTSNHGTRSKHEVVLSKLMKFLQGREKRDLLFSEITPNLLDDLQHYLRTEKDPKKLSENSATHYIKIIKSVVSKANKDDYYSFIKSPFNSLELKSKPVKKPILTLDEVDRLLNARLTDASLNMYRNMFLFQIFSNGMRVSDLLLTRIMNFTNGRLEYTMYKTGAPISMPINLNMAFIISELAEFMPQYGDYLEKEEVEFRDEKNEIHSLNLRKLKKLIRSLKTTVYTSNPLVNAYLNEMNERIDGNMGKLTDYKGHKIDIDNSKLRELIDLEETLQNKVDDAYLKALTQALSQVNKKSAKEFLFPVLNSTDFGAFKGNEITEGQYRKLKHATIVYNRNLKKVQEACEIETNLSSHISRHTFTNLLLQMAGVNLYDVSLSLGHSNIKVTEHYLRTGFNAEKLDELNTGLAGKFRKS